jgi:AGZA family xanthine/uracil permease-like MFS transporter
MYGTQQDNVGLDDGRPKIQNVAVGGDFETGGRIISISEREDTNSGIIKKWLNKKFELSKRNTNIGREFRAGTATFLTMSYIVIVNARVAGGSSGIPSSDVMIGTAASSAIGSFVCGYFGNLPFALAPGLGLSAYLSVGLASSVPHNTISKKVHHSEVVNTPQWQSALAACAVAGMVQVVMANRLSLYLMKGTPRSVQVGTVVGMGLLIAFVALQQIGMVERAPNTPVHYIASNSTEFRAGGPLVQLGDNAYSAESMLACFGLVTVTFLAHHDIPGSVLMAVGMNTLISIWILGTQPPLALFGWPVPDKAFLAWDFGSLTVGKHLPAVLAFILVGVFDIAGVMIGLSHIIGLEQDADGIPKGSSWAFFAAGVGTVVGAMFGSTPVIVHLESAAGL